MFSRTLSGYRSSRRFVSMASTLVGRSGYTYTRERILQEHPKRPALNIWLATGPDQGVFVLKPTSAQVFDLAQHLKREFGNEKRLRNHVDENVAEHVLVYDYYQINLLNLVNFNADIPLKPRKYILREVGLALRTLHRKDYVHLGKFDPFPRGFASHKLTNPDLKPDNVMLDWKVSPSGRFEPTRVVLSDMDCAYKIEEEELLDLKMGNVMWRSPEGQAGRGVGKASEVFSFGLMCLFTVTGTENFHPDFAQLKADGNEPEHVIIYKMLQTFGPAPPGLTAHVRRDELWTDLLTGFSEIVNDQDESDRFQNWNESAFPNLNADTKRFILRMTNLDPRARATIDQIMEDPWWDRE